jgi:hypothetical protein
MNNKFDELAKEMAQSVSRRSALKKFSVGLAGMALACFGLADKAQAKNTGCGVCMKLCRAYGHPRDYCRSYCKQWGC